MNPSDEICFQGAPVSDGIAIGVPFFVLSPEDEDLPEFPITVAEVEEEIARYRRALFSSREDLQKLQCDLATEGSLEAVTILDTHIQMLDDPMITTQMEEKIRHNLQNTESVFRSVINEYETRFSQMSDTFFQQRLIDVMDLSKRILGHLCHRDPASFSEIPYNSVVFVKELIPSHTAAAQASRTSAFVTQIGGGNSHAALIARAKGIPYVAGVNISPMHQMRGKFVIVDGMTGKVIVNPTPGTLEKYKKMQKLMDTKYQKLVKEVHLNAETIDGFETRVFANIGALSDLEALHAVGASGVGLFRSEYLFLQNNNAFPTEEEQVALYLELIDKSQGLPIVIRVFDIGGDKNPELLTEFEKEPNPVLGCRGIRFLLRKKEVFKSQLRAILRASAHGDLRILLPLISDILELRESKQIVEETKKELASQGIAYNKNIPIGSMIEVPSAVLIGDLLAKECDFLSIGTNDLVQYTLGIDRSNPSMSDFCYPAHPSVIRMIQIIALESRRRNKPVSLCGEMASNPLFIPLLLGLGIDEFSCAPRYIPVIKRSIRQCSIVDCYKMAQQILKMETSKEVADFLIEESRRLELACEH